MSSFVSLPLATADRQKRSFTKYLPLTALLFSCVPTAQAQNRETTCSILPYESDASVISGPVVVRDVSGQIRSISLFTTTSNGNTMRIEIPGSYVRSALALSPSRPNDTIYQIIFQNTALARSVTSGTFTCVPLRNLILHESIDAGVGRLRDAPADVQNDLTHDAHRSTRVFIYM
ncbi:MAG: hypothetical protein ACP5N9_01970 [Candidatus Bilamarchaeum sp.]